MGKGERLVDVTEKVLESSVVTGKLRFFEWMMKTNKEPYIWRGRVGNEERTAATVEIPKKRNKNAKRTDRKY